MLLRGDSCGVYEYATKGVERGIVDLRLHAMMRAISNYAFRRNNTGEFICVSYIWDLGII